MYDSTKNYSLFYVPAAAKCIPVPVEFKLPTRDSIGMHPLELELMMFICNNNSSLSLYDRIFVWGLQRCGS
jgi:hypothetical protein